MRLACPECAAEYDVPEAALGAARRLRCTACGTSWDWTPQATPPPEPEPDEPAAAPEAPAEPPPENTAPPPPRIDASPIEAARIGGARIEVAREERIATAPPPARAGARGSGGVALAWILSLAILLAAAAALYAWRVPVMAAWPPSIRLYAALGLG
jgi:predicted Zn finger-like uncharacterized protein